MFDCLVCSEPFYSKKSTNSKSETSSRKRCFHYFCQLLGLSPEQSETFSLEYDFSKEIPFCVKCHKFATDLTKHGESRETLEDDIVSLQLSICDKLRDVSETTIQIDKIVRQVRSLVKNPLRFLRSKGRDVGDVEDEDDKDFRGLEIRNLIIQLTPPEEIKPRKERIRNPNRNRKAKKRKPKELVERFPACFVTPDAVNLTIPKVEIKDEPIDVDIEDAEAWAWACSVTAPAADSEDEIEEGISSDPLSLESMNEDDLMDNYESLCILPEAQADATDDKEKHSIAQISKILPQKKHPRKTKHVVKESEDSISDHGDDDIRDKDYTVKKEVVKKQPREKNQKSKIKPLTILPKLRTVTLKCMEYLGEIETSDENKMSFKGIKLIEASGNAFECGRCGEKIKHRLTIQKKLNIWASLNIRRHIQEKHFGGYKCSVCSKEGYTNFQGYMKHSKKHLQAPVQCPVCLKPFLRNSKFFKAHIWSHKNEAEKEEAIKSGIQPPKLRPQKTPSRNDQCVQCGKCFVGRAALKTHEEIHKDKTEREKVPCPICGKMYVESSLPSHLRYFHEKERRIPVHACKFCGRSFILASVLQRHVRVNHEAHLFEKSFACQMCSKTFFSKISLTAHMRSHSDARPFSCTICSAAFKAKSNLQRHVKASHQASVDTSSVVVQVPQEPPPNHNYDQYSQCNTTDNL